MLGTSIRRNNRALEGIAVGELSGGGMTGRAFVSSYPFVKSVRRGSRSTMAYQRGLGWAWAVPRGRWGGGRGVRLAFGVVEKIERGLVKKRREMRTQQRFTRNVFVDSWCMSLGVAKSS